MRALLDLGVVRREGEGQGLMEQMSWSESERWTSRGEVGSREGD